MVNTRASTSGGEASGSGQSGATGGVLRWEKKEGKAGKNSLVYGAATPAIQAYITTETGSALIWLTLARKDGHYAE